MHEVHKGKHSFQSGSEHGKSTRFGQFEQKTNCKHTWRNHTWVLSLFLNFLHTFIHTKAHNTIALMLYHHHKDLSMAKGWGLRNCQTCGKSLWWINFHLNFVHHWAKKLQSDIESMTSVSMTKQHAMSGRSVVERELCNWEYKLKP